MLPSICNVQDSSPVNNDPAPNVNSVEVEGPYLGPTIISSVSLVM